MTQFRAKSPVQIARYLRSYGKGIKASFWLGAGASVSAGIPAADDLAEDILQQIEYLPRDAWSTQSEITRYAHLMSTLAPVSRRMLLKKRLDAVAGPNKTHLLLARMIQEGWVNLVLTTNFDNLLPRAMRFLGMGNPWVADVHREGETVADGLSDGAIVHFNGVADNHRTFASPAQAQRVAGSVRQAIFRAVQDSVVIVLGYSGYKDPLFDLLAEVPHFAHGLFWVTQDTLPAPHVQEGILRPGRYTEFLGPLDADQFMHELVIDGLGLADPGPAGPAPAYVPRTPPPPAPPVPPFAPAVKPPAPPAPPAPEAGEKLSDIGLEDISLDDINLDDIDLENIDIDLDIDDIGDINLDAIDLAENDGMAHEAIFTLPPEAEEEEVHPEALRETKAPERAAKPADEKPVTAPPPAPEPIVETEVAPAEAPVEETAGPTDAEIPTAVLKAAPQPAPSEMEITPELEVIINRANEAQVIGGSDDLLHDARRVLSLHAEAAYAPLADALMDWGDELYSKGDGDSALAAYNLVRELAPDMPEPYVRLGVLYADNGDKDRSEEMLRKADELKK